MKDLFEEVITASRGKLGVALCILTGTRGSTPRKAGAKMLVYEDGSISGTIGGGALEESVIRNAVKVIRTGEPMFMKHDLLHQHSMCCGGTAEIYIEKVKPRCSLYIFGAGHTGQALAKMAALFEYDIFLVDSRYDYVHQCKEEQVNKMNLPYKDAVRILPFNLHTYSCIMTHDHACDREILFHCIQQPFAYLGMIGSKRKCEMTKKMLREGFNLPEEQISRVDMPMGMAMNAEGPQEIALSILAGLIKVKNEKASWVKELQL